MTGSIVPKTVRLEFLFPEHEIVRTRELLEISGLTIEGLLQTGLMYGDRIFVVGDEDFSMKASVSHGAGSLIDFFGSMYYVAQSFLMGLNSWAYHEIDGSGAILFEVIQGHDLIGKQRLNCVVQLCGNTKAQFLLGDFINASKDVNFRLCEMIIELFPEIRNHEANMVVLVNAILKCWCL